MAAHSPETQPIGQAALATTLRVSFAAACSRVPRMAHKIALICFVALAYLTGAAAADLTTLSQEVRDAEQSFANTMAARDHAAFTRHLADDAVFFDGDKAIRGKAAIASAWKPFFDGPNPPFSWSPETVEVLDSGTLAHSSGPVLDPNGKRVGTFNSVWRREPDGTWRVVFDKACNACDCMKAQATSGDSHGPDANREGS